MKIDKVIVLTSKNTKQSDSETESAEFNMATQTNYREFDSDEDAHSSELLNWQRSMERRFDKPNL